MNGHSASPETLDTRHHELLSVDRLTGQKTTTPAPTTGSGDVTGSDVIITSSQHRHGHTHTHRGPQPISPPPPSPQISAADLLLLTEASATHNGTFQCTLCSKQFGYKNGLIRHVRLTHVGEKPYQCSICNRRFGYKHILMEHQNLHFGNRPYACHLCDKRFAARSNLIQHRMVHRRPYSCALCSKRFDREDQLKKHLFAHPQSHVTGPQGIPGPPANGGVDTSPPSSHEADEDSKTADNNADRHSPDKSPRLAQPPPPLQQSPSYTSPEPTRSSSGHRIDAICTQLISSRQHPTPPLGGPSPPSTAPSSSLYEGVVVKKEIEDFTTPDCGSNVDSSSAEETNSYRHHHDFSHHHHHHHQQHSSPRSDAAAAAAAAAERDNSKLMFFSPSRHSPAHSALAALTDWSSPGSRYASGGVASSEFILEKQQTKSSLSSSSVVAAAAAAALPGIHEVFSKRQHQQQQSHQKLPSFANFMPPAVNAAAARRSSPYAQSTLSASSSMFSPAPAPAAASVVNPTPQRPTAQLPPITHHPGAGGGGGGTTLLKTRDQAVQHSQSVAGFPSLDDVLSYYVSQGRLFRCQHCSILFFERGMYFLHASLHGLTSPWECSICHKVCSDKNEFTLHFVNQQHNP